MPNNFTSLVNSDVATQLEKALDCGALFITPNTRLAAYLRELLDDIMLNRHKAGQGAWESPDLIPFEAWTVAQWTSSMLSGKTAPRLILTTGQDAFYWERALDQSPIAQTLMSPAAAAAQAQQGYQLLKQALVDIDQHAFEFNSAVDSRAFYDWIKHYKALLQDSGHIALVDAQSELLSLNLHDTVADQLVVMVGFQSPTPLQKALIHNYAKTGGHVESIHLNVGCKSIQFKGFSDFSQEVKAAAAWSKGLQDKNPDSRIAVVIQNLAQNRMLVERSLLEAFEPASKNTVMPSLLPGYNMSAGIPLSESSVIKVGLAVIDAISRPLPLEQWLALLSSPYIGDDQSDVLVRRSLMAKLHDAGEREYSLSQISRLLSWRSGNKKTSNIDVAEQQGVSDAASLASGIDAAAQYFISWQSGRGQNQSKQNFPSQWLPVFRKILGFFLWPGSRTLNSDEYQQLSRFEAQCESFSGFDAVVGKITLAAAAQLFRRHCQQQVFHRETVRLPGAPKHVQVLGGLEASGQTFDHIWLMGMSERQWPAMPQAHPLIPRLLQLEYAMPSSSVEREFEYAKQLTTAYLSSATEVVVSYPLSVDDIACDISPLVDGLATDLAQHFEIDFIRDTHGQGSNSSGSIDGETSGFDKQDAALTTDEATIETIADHYGKPLSANSAHNDTSDTEPQVLAGGSAMLKDYNTNPLKTYLKWRLGARPLGEVVLGVSALERGNAIHAALELIWQALGGSAALQDCTAEQISQLVSDSADAALDEVFAQRFAPLSVRLRILEKQRLQNTLDSWLTLESDRPGFIIESLERALVFSIGGQTLRLRIDRIDRLEDGQLILIDYKSGATQPSGWLDDAVTEPQLPLYVCAMDDAAGKPPMAIAFARLKAGDLAYEGIGPEESAALDIKGIKGLAAKRNHDIADWAALAEHWQQRLTLAINEIAAGNAAVDITRRRVDDPVYEPIMRLHCSDTTATEGELS